MSVDVFTARSLAGLPHGFLGRRGGASTGACAGLNVGLGSGDEDATMTENRRRAADAIRPGATLLAPYQTHSAEVTIVHEPFDPLSPDRPRADALVTRSPGLLIGVVTADCAPVLLADREAGVVAAVHAGWRGALAGITDRTLDAMERIGADRRRVAAAIGPCIAQASYEVDDAFAARFGEADPANERFFADATPGHPRFDLEGYVAHRLAAAGVPYVEALGLDTCADEARFFSYRRATLRAEAAYGRQASAIAAPVAAFER